VNRWTWLAGAALLVLASAVPALADEVPVETQIVDALNKVWGVHPGFRANHAKGVVLEGSFTASPDAAHWSKAAIFSGTRIPVTVRFSDSGGLPTIPDGAAVANPHGMAIKFHLANGDETDMVLNSLAFFPVSSGAGFRDLLLAIAASKPGTAEQTPLDRFLAAHPAAPAALASVHTPDSLAHEVYNGVDAFVLVNAAGKRQAIRYRVTPDQVVHLDPTDAAKQPPDFLMQEIVERVRRGPVTFHLKAQIAAAGDPTADATKPWPDSRQLVDLGVLTIDHAMADSAAAQKQLLFLPGRLIDGIEASDDPLIDVRDGAYAVSFARRSQ